MDIKTDKRTPLIAIIGPTAVGKTFLSIEIAKRLGAEVISVDSRQVYRYLDVGTDKVSYETRRRVPHHLIDVADPDQIYTAADFAAQASDAVTRIMKRGRMPLLAGGTPFYYRALCGVLSQDLPKDTAVREQIEKEVQTDGLGALYEELKRVDPKASFRIHPNDTVRTMRAIEIYRITGKSATWWYERQERIASSYDILYIGLIRSRENLYKNIEERVKKQFASGYPEEVEWLLSNGYSPTLPAMQGFGYRELVWYLTGKCTLEEALLGDIRSTKAFSRRQMTWFRRFEPAIWYDLDCSKIEDVIESALLSCAKHAERGR